MKSRAFCIDRVLVVCANRSGKIFYKVITSKAKTKQYFEAARICCVNRAELNRLEKLFSHLSGERFFVYYASNLPIFPQCFGKRISCLNCCLQELWICCDTKRFSFSPTLMLLAVIALYTVYLFVWLKVKISRGKLRARIFSGGFLHLFKASRDLCFK